jgi:hypothetical protein
VSSRRQRRDSDVVVVADGALSFRFARAPHGVHVTRQERWEGGSTLTFSAVFGTPEAFRDWLHADEMLAPYPHCVDELLHRASALFATEVRA